MSNSLHPNFQIKELQAIKNELVSLKNSAAFNRVKNVLNNEITKVDQEIIQLKKLAEAAEEDKPKTPTKVNVDIKEHAFDESDKYCKIFIPFDASKLKEEDVELTLTEDSLALIINGENKKHQFIVNGLLQKIQVDKSYKKLKSDMIVLYLKKVKEVTWGCLTKTEKHLKDQKTKMFDKDDNEEGGDPGNALMNMMKKMYDSGDSDMKRTIAKAWSESQQKQMENPYPMS